MRFILVSPVRVVSDGWEEFSRDITKLFDAKSGTDAAQNALGRGWIFQPDVNYKYHSLEQEKVVVGKVFEQPFMDALSAAFKRVRRNGFAIRSLRENAVAVVFNTSEACVVEIHEVHGDTDQVLEVIANERNRSNELVNEAIHHLQDLASRTSTSFENGETITHTLIASDVSDETTDQVAKRCFDAEGLEYAPKPLGPFVYFTPGWSFSVCQSEVETKFWDSVAVMVRAQCEWYAVRIARDYCLRTLGDTNLRSRVGQLLDLERAVVGYQTGFRLWRHRMEEYRANLKPGLTDQAKSIEGMWKTLEAKDYVNETLGQARNLIQSSYSRRLLIQERRQSVMIFLLTALGVLSVSSVAATYWNWLILAKLVEQSMVSTPEGSQRVVVMLVGLVVVMGVWISWFVFSRFKKD